jgi:uncharacterized protein with PIN domain
MQKLFDTTFLIVVIFSLSSALLFVRKFTQKSSCPNCNSIRDMERIKSASIYKAIPLVHARHYICYKCNKKHYKFSFKQINGLVKSNV